MKTMFVNASIGPQLQRQGAQEELSASPDEQQKQMLAERRKW